MIFTDKDGKVLKEGDYIRFEHDKTELLYACDIDGENGLGVNASRHYKGSELYPLTEFPNDYDEKSQTYRLRTGVKQ